MPCPPVLGNRNRMSLAVEATARRCAQSPHAPFHAALGGILARCASQIWRCDGGAEAGSAHSRHPHQGQTVVSEAEPYFRWRPGVGDAESRAPSTEGPSVTGDTHTDDAPRIARSACLDHIGSLPSSGFVGAVVTHATALCRVSPAATRRQLVLRRTTTRGSQPWRLRYLGR